MSLALANMDKTISSTKTQMQVNVRPSNTGSAGLWVKDEAHVVARERIDREQRGEQGE